MSTIFWKKIGKGSWINIGGDLSVSKPILIGNRALERGRRTGLTLGELTNLNFFNSSQAAVRAQRALRRMGHIPHFGEMEL